MIIFFVEINPSMIIGSSKHVSIFICLSKAYDVEIVAE